MKKLIITAACVAAAVSGFAQGTVSFQNNTALSAIYLNNSSTTANKVGSGTLGSMSGSGTPSSTGVVEVGLFWSTSQFNTAAGGTLAGVATIGTTAGVFSGNGNFGIATTNPNDTVFLQIFAWDSSYGTTQAGLEACIAAGGYFGAASAGNANTTYGAIGAATSVVMGAAGGPGTLIYAPSGTITKTIMLQNAGTVPEPATIAIGGLGAAALLMFRRRK
jgi:PEP-CTERM motif